MKINCTSPATKIALVVLGLCLGSCVQNSLPIPKAEYSTHIVGRWQGTVGDLKETMLIATDGTFTCQVRHRGFIANTLSQSVPGTIRGRWTITAVLINLRITGAENEALKNSTTSSTIDAFTEDKLVLRSDRGETSTFERVHDL
jgi:hypothetical protein